MSTEIARIELSAGSIETVMIDGQPHIVLKPAIEALGLSYSPQLRKLKTRSWGVVTETVTRGADGRIFEMAATTVRSFLMLMANVNENRVSETARPILVAFQNETADAIEAYWTRGGAVNPAATREQVADLRERLDGVERARLAQGRLSAMGVAKQFGLVNSSYVEAMARTELARMNGAEPDIDPADITITCDEFLTQRGVNGADLSSARVKLGKGVAALYRMRYGQDPQKIKRPINGVHRDVAVYTHRDIDLFETAWAEIGRHYDVQTAIGGAA
ncbi:phage antirepressor N-terminal domain-containing protein [Streptomyces griseoincarnatus]